MPIPFDTNQKKVIDHRGRPLLILAGPGTGKTATLIERIVQILKKDPLSNVIFITFTRTSRKDAKKRIEKVMPMAEIYKEPEFPRVTTLHGFANAILHKYAERKLIGIDSNFRVLAPSKEELVLIKDLVRDLSLPIKPEDLRDEINKAKCLGNVNGSLEPLFKAYEKIMSLYNAIDIPNLIYQTIKLLQNKKIMPPNLYLHIDEYQDLNAMDQKFVDQIIKSGNHGVVVCGDDEQSIYGFRFARPEGIRSIWNSPEWERVSFTKCTRLPTTILRASIKLIEAHRGPHIAKPIEIPGTTCEKITVFQCTKPCIEIKQIIKHIKETKIKIRKRDGSPLLFKDFMILCPTNAIVEEFAKALSENKIKAKTVLKRKIPDSIWGAFLILRLSENDDGMALRQWLEIVGIDEDKIQDLRRTSLKTGGTFFDIARQSSDKKIRNVISMIDKLRLLNKDPQKLLATIKTQYKKYLTIDANFNELEMIAENSISVAKLINCIYEKYGISDKEDEIIEEENSVLVTTLHSSKGLEAAVVYIVRTDKRLLPLPKRDWDEELRSFYVGMTRAEQMLFFSFSEIFEVSSNGRPKPLKQEAASPFLKQIMEFLDFKRITVRDL